MGHELERQEKQIMNGIKCDATEGGNGRLK